MADDELGRPPVSGQTEALEAGNASVSTPVARKGEMTPEYRGTGVSASLVVGLVLAVIAIIVSVQNTDDTNVDFLAWDLDAPLVAIILAAVVAGVLLDETLGFFWRRRRRRHLAERTELRRLRQS